MKIHRKNFYFVRHGESECNVNPHIGDEVDVALTLRGMNQAQSIQSIIETLPIQTICVSPLRRALDTKEIIAKNISCPVIVIEELEECTSEIWFKMTQMENGVISCEQVQSFVQRAVSGINKALSYPGPVLIVAHGGVHYAMCHHMQIEEYDKKIHHCTPAHFSISEMDTWKAKHLAIPTD